MCGHTFIHSPPVRAIKRMLKASTLGDVYFISSSRVNLDFTNATRASSGISDRTTSRSCSIG